MFASGGSGKVGQVEQIEQIERGKEEQRMQNRSSGTQEWRRELHNKIEGHRARLGVIGLGYVGLPLAVEMAEAGFQVTGLDVDRTKVNKINAGDSYIPDVATDALGEMVRAGRLQATQSFDTIEQLDTISICVPTPLGKSRDPDLSYILAAVEAVVRTCGRVS